MMVVKQINGQSESEGWFGAKDLKEDSHIRLEDEEEQNCLIYYRDNTTTALES